MVGVVVDVDVDVVVYDRVMAVDVCESASASPASKQRLTNGPLQQCLPVHPPSILTL